MKYRKIFFFLFITSLSPPLLFADSSLHLVYQANKTTEIKLENLNGELIRELTLTKGHNFLFEPRRHDQGIYKLTATTDRRTYHSYLVVHKNLPKGFLKIDHNEDIDERHWAGRLHNLNFQFFGNYEGHFFIDVRGLGNITKHPYDTNIINPERHFSFSPGTYRMEFFHFDGRKEDTGHLLTLDLKLEETAQLDIYERKSFLKAKL